jgi:hypothetical protein
MANFLVAKTGPDKGKIFALDEAFNVLLGRTLRAVLVERRFVLGHCDTSRPIRG